MKSQNRVTSFDPVESWIDNVAYSHSGSPHTELEYRMYLKRFCIFVGKTPDQILEEYEQSDERSFKRKYARFLKAWIGSLMREGYQIGTIRVMVMSVRSFFKYSDLALGHVPTAKNIIVYHNREITKEEIKHVLSISRPRDRAFYLVMISSGLRPSEVCSLRLKHLQPDLRQGRIPCKIEVPQSLAKGKFQRFFTFIGEEASAALRNYLKTRRGLTDESYVFTKYGKEKPLTYSNISTRFRTTLQRLRGKGVVKYERRKGHPSELRLYSLRKYFRKNTMLAGADFVNFWMGHTSALGVDLHYFSRDVEHHRLIYEEQAMPHLRLETATPTETDRVIAKQADEMERLKMEIQKLRLQAAENKELKRRTQLTEQKLSELSNTVAELKKLLAELSGDS